jgi:transposase InsO family protein
MDRASNHRGFPLERSAPLSHPRPRSRFRRDRQAAAAGHGIRDKPIAPASPWQNAYAERLIGSIRRECVDHLIIAGEAHLRRTLRAYTYYYTETRTHRSLLKDAPKFREIQRSALSERTRFLAAFTTDTSESSFRHRQGSIQT